MALTILYPSTGTRMIFETGVGAEGGAQFEAYTIDGDGAYAKVTAQTSWASSDPNVLSPSTLRAGSFGFRRPGSAVIVAIYQGLQATFPVVVREPPPMPHLRISWSSGFLGVSRERTPPAGLSTVTSSVTWTTSDERVATVTDRNQVRLGVVGNVQITASFDGLSDSLWLSSPPRGQ